MKAKRQSSHRQEKGNVQLFVFLTLVILLVIQTTILWQNGTLPNLLKTVFPSLPVPSGAPGDAPSGPTPTPTPTELKSGSETYTISQSSNVTGPRISRLTLDPLDVKQGQTQVLTVRASSPQGISAVSIEFQSDNKTESLVLSQTGGTTQDGDWQTTWTLDDTVLYKYILTISATGAAGKSSVIVAPRQ